MRARRTVRVSFANRQGKICSGCYQTQCRRALGVSVRSKDDSWGLKRQYNINIGLLDLELLTYGIHRKNSSTVHCAHDMASFQSHAQEGSYPSTRIRNKGYAHCATPLSVVMPRPPLRIGSLGLACSRKYERRETERERRGQVGGRVLSKKGLAANEGLL